LVLLLIWATDTMTNSYRRCKIFLLGFSAIWPGRTCAKY
jgi:hypothetical protein